MKQELTKSFTLIIGGIILLVLNVIPDHDLGGLVTAASGLDFQSIPVVLIGIGLILTGAMNIIKSEEFNSKPESKMFLYILLGGVGVSFITLFLSGTVEIIAQILVIILLLVGYFQLKKSLRFSFDNEATKGALWVLVGGILSIYKEIGGGLGFKIIAIVGLAIFFMGLGKLAGSLDELGAKGAKKLRMAVILSVVATFFDMIPLMGIIAGIIAIVAFIIELTGYLALKESGAIQEIGQRGTKLLVINMVLLLIASLFGIIPFVGDMIVGFIATISLVLWNIGWLRIELGTVK